MAIDPICGMEVDEKTGLNAEYEGKTYYFCNPGCRDRFLSGKGVIPPVSDQSESPLREKEGEQNIEKATLDIKGMHCASCAVAIEDSLKKTEGVSKATVNFATERAYVEYDPETATPQALEQAIEKAGYSVIREQPESLNLKVIGMDNAHCLGTVEAALKNIKGIRSSQLFLNERAIITFDPALTSRQTIKKAIRDAGYTPVEEATVDREKEARQSDIRTLKIKFLLAAVFGIPLLYFAMGHHVGLPLPSITDSAMALIQLALTTPIVIVGY